jgi:ABC-type Zn uptake system ZnuABC Zn-binding protein ZnuA
MPFKSKAQQGYMFKNMPKIALKWAKHTPDMKNLPQHVEEGLITERKKNDIEFYTVLLPEDHTSKVADLVKHHTPIEFAEAIQKGDCTYNEVEGFYLDESEAQAAAQAIVKGLYETAKSLEEKKEKVSTALQKKIDNMHKEAQAAMNLARKEPENADAHRAHSQALLEKIKAWETKHKTVAGSKKELQPLEEFEAPKKSKKSK